MTFAHHHATHSFVLSIALFHFVPHVPILANAGGGLIGCHFLDISKVLLSFHIFLSSMLEINVYSIIDSKVFGVKIGVNFLLAIVE